MPWHRRFDRAASRGADAVTLAPMYPSRDAPPMTIHHDYVLPQPRETEDERFQRLMDELDLLAAVLEDVDSDEVADSITMWIDYMIYRALNATDQQPECAPEARECRKLIMAHLDRVAWSDHVVQPAATP